MNQEDSNKQKEDCPLCETAKEAVDTLNTNKDSGIENKKLFQKIKTIFLCLAIIFGIIGIYKVLSDYSSTSSVSEYNLIKGQSTNVSKKVNPQINVFAPDFTSEDVWGNKFSISDFRGKKPILLIFWATWCRQCAKELTDLKVFNKKHYDNIQVIAVDSGESKETIKDYIQEKDVNFLMLLDKNKEIWNTYLIRGTPSHFLIGKDGRIVTVRPGHAFLSDLEAMLSMVLVK